MPVSGDDTAGTADPAAGAVRGGTVPAGADADGTVPERLARLRVPNWVYRIARILVHAICRTYWRVHVDYEGRVPESGPVILAPVHRSFMDFFVVSEATPRKVFYMAKDDLWDHAALGSVIEALGGFPVNREGADRLALDRARSVLERGDVLILFPEGTRRSGPVVEDLHGGVAFLAARTGASVVPIGIGGTEHAMPKGSRFVRPVKVHLVVGAPLDPPPRTDRGRVPRSQLAAFTERIRGEVQRLFDEAQARAGV